MRETLSTTIEPTRSGSIAAAPFCQRRFPFAFFEWCWQPTLRATNQRGLAQYRAILSGKPVRFTLEALNSLYEKARQSPANQGHRALPRTSFRSNRSAPALEASAGAALRLVAVSVRWRAPVLRASGCQSGAVRSGPLAETLANGGRRVRPDNEKAP